VSVELCVYGCFLTITQDSINGCSKRTKRLEVYSIRCASCLLCKYGPVGDSWCAISNDQYIIPLIFSKAAFDVYIRRAYRAYTLLSIDYEEGDGTDDGEAPSIVTWRFNLGQSHSPPQTPRLDKLGCVSDQYSSPLVSSQSHSVNPLAVMGLLVTSRT